MDVMVWTRGMGSGFITTGAAGIGFLLVGLAVFFSLGDLVLLMLSGMLTLCTLLNCVEFYRTVRRRRYQAIEAACIALGRPSIGRRREIQLLLQDGREVVVTWDKRVNLRIGRRYRIFYRLDCAPPHGGAGLHDLPAGNLLLALEDLGESCADAAIEDKEDA